LAGFFDGEGTINVHISKPNQKNREVNPGFVVRVGLGNTNLEIVDLLHQNFGGYRNQKSQRLGRKPYYVWGTSGQKAVTFLKTVLPYLRQERTRAELAIELRERITTTERRGLRRPGGGGLPTSITELEARKNLADKINDRRDGKQTFIKRKRARGKQLDLMLQSPLPNTFTEKRK